MQTKIGIREHKCMFYLATLVFSSNARFSYLSLPIFYFSKMVSQYQCFRYHYLCKPSIFKLWFALNVSEENETICGGNKMKTFVHGDDSIHLEKQKNKKKHKDT